MKYRFFDHTPFVGQLFKDQESYDMFENLIMTITYNNAYNSAMVYEESRDKSNDRVIFDVKSNVYENMYRNGALYGLVPLKSKEQLETEMAALKEL